MGIKLLSLNIEGHKHWDRIEPFLAREKFDVLCLQELFASDIPILNGLGYQGYFMPQTKITKPNNQGHAPLGNHGIGIFSHHPHSLLLQEYYDVSSDYALSDFDTNNPNDVMRALLLAEIFVDSSVFHIATIHFTWTPDGSPNERQLANAEKVLGILAPYVLSGLILTGDFNAPRGKATFSRFAETLTDNIPDHHKTSLDPKLHRLGQDGKKGVDGLMVDGLFSKRYQVKNVRLVDGLSDHCGIVCDILTP